MHTPAVIKQVIWLVGKIMMWWWCLYFTSGSQGLLWHFRIAPQFCLWCHPHVPGFSLSIARYMCQEFLISPVVNLLRWCYCDYICWWPHKEYLQKTYRPHRCMDSLGIAVILSNHTNPHVAHIRVGFWYKRSFFYCVEF